MVKKFTTISTIITWETSCFVIYSFKNVAHFGVKKKKKFPLHWTSAAIFIGKDKDLQHLYGEGELMEADKARPWTGGCGLPEHAEVPSAYPKHFPQLRDDTRQHPAGLHEGPNPHTWLRVFLQDALLLRNTSRAFITPHKHDRKGKALILQQAFLWGTPRWAYPQPPPPCLTHSKGALKHVLST